MSFDSELAAHGTAGCVDFEFPSHLFHMQQTSSGTAGPVQLAFFLKLRKLVARPAVAVVKEPIARLAICEMAGFTAGETAVCINSE
jgi:hypothetical protein